jgi:hypothetical protein
MMGTGLIVIVVIVAAVVVVALAGFPRISPWRAERDTDIQRAAAADVAEVQENDEYNPDAPGNQKDDL